MIKLIIIIGIIIIIIIIIIIYFSFRTLISIFCICHALVNKVV